MTNEINQQDTLKDAQNANTETKYPRIAVFASGTGSNFQAMLNDPVIAKHIGLLVCDQYTAPVIDYARQHGIATFVFMPKEFTNKAAYEKEIIQVLKDLKIEWVFLAGYMRIVGNTLLTAFKEKIVNIHPSYLPAFPGKDAVGQAIRAEAETTGVTVHFVDAGIDTGPIITREAIDILPDDSLETLTTRIQEVEHVLYPKVMKQLMGVL